MTLKADIRNIEARIQNVEKAIEAGHFTDGDVVLKLRSQLAILVGMLPPEAPAKPKKKRSRKKKATKEA